MSISTPLKDEPPAGAEFWSQAPAACGRFPAASPDTVSAAQPHCDWSHSQLLCYWTGKQASNRTWWDTTWCHHFPGWDTQHQSTYRSLNSPVQGWGFCCHSYNVNILYIHTVWMWWKFWRIYVRSRNISNVYLKLFTRIPFPQTPTIPLLFHLWGKYVLHSFRLPLCKHLSLSLSQSTTLLPELLTPLRRHESCSTYIFNSVRHVHQLK